MRFQDAPAHKIARLYHYQAFAPGYLRSVLVKHCLHFSDPRNFNDPWDCKPFFRVDHLSDPQEQERLIAWYKEITRKHGPNLPEAELERRACHFRAHPEELVHKTMEMSRVMGETIGEHYRIYCLTPHPDSELMWAHYSKAHTGVCLEFDATYPVISTAQAVWYSKDYPNFDVVGSGVLVEEVAPLFTKSASWSYEEEHRLVSQERAHARNDETFITDNGGWPLPAGALKAVIIGCLADDATRKAVRDMVVEGCRGVVVKQIERARDRYQLVISG